MSSTKIVILFLILIALLFVVLVVRGSLADDEPQASAGKAAENFTKQKQAPDWIKTIKDAFAWLQPKVQLPCGQTGELAKKCENLQLKTSFLVLPDNRQSFRTANFRLINGSANICYRTNENAPSCADAKDLDKNAKPNLEAQSFDLPDSDAADPQRGTIVVLKKGGKITVICKSIPCKVDLE